MKQGQSQVQATVLKQTAVPKPVQVMASEMLQKTDAEMMVAVSTALDVNVALERLEEHEDFDNDLSGDDSRDEGFDIPGRSSYIGQNQPANDKTLIEDLEDQIKERDLTEFQQKIARYVIGNLDDDGYLRRSAGQISDDLIMTAGVDIDPDCLDNEVANIIEVVRDLNPAGVGARNLQDCLLLQLGRKRCTRVNTLAYSVVDEYFEAFAARHYDKICRELKITDDEWKEVILTIRRLTPYPTGQFISQSEVQGNQIIPDFKVTTEDDEITLELSNKIPELQISKTYSDYVASGKASEVERAMVEQAKTFAQALKMRQTTLFRVMDAIVKRQMAFFLSGDDNDLKPMVIRDIEHDTGIDSSLISRATNGKYVDTMWGNYPLRHFFSESIKNTKGEEVTNKEIMKALQGIIDSENKRKPLSDERLSELLEQKGYPISRRTVAKYRDKMAIPAASLRRERQ